MENEKQVGTLKRTKVTLSSVNCESYFFFSPRLSLPFFLYFALLSVSGVLLIRILSPTFIPTLTAFIPAVILFLVSP